MVATGRRETVMKNEYLSTVKQAIDVLKIAQTRHSRQLERAHRRLAVATARFEDDSRAAIQIEAEAWARLLSIPGMSVASAAAITQVHETTVAKWAARVAKAGTTGAGR